MQENLTHAEHPRPQFGLRQLFFALFLASMVCFWISLLASQTSNWSAISFRSYPAIHLIAVLLISRFKTWRAGLIGAAILTGIVMTAFTASGQSLLHDFPLQELVYGFTFCGISGGAIGARLDAYRRGRRSLGSLAIFCLVLWVLAGISFPAPPGWYEW